MKFLASVAALGAMAVSVSAFVFPSEPLAASKYKPNDIMNISWTEDNKPPLLSSAPIFNIYFMTGSNLVQTKLATVAENVDPSKTTSVPYKVPYVSPPGQIYFLYFETKDLKGQAWATRFTVTDELGTAMPTFDPLTNPGGNGTIVTPTPKPTTAAPTATGNDANPTATAAGKSGASTLTASMSVAAAVVGALAMAAF
ncbi:hypothetical protein BG006_000617 [Podila minutissima]|uniref:Yeast cell wall synthesis Kre9/Knh1-like N-terminal domain-containing protein n=1 Tax=Podila minutissima TaxID=64525 RepID=A0A9P5SS34_9FUNG|nr:hypothetical protein BG006_000617 [Podila minutissima]